MRCIAAVAGPSRAERLFVAQPSPVAAAKAVKNEAELAGMREAHLRDAVALAETFTWLEQQVGAGCDSSRLALELGRARADTAQAMQLCDSALCFCDDVGEW